MSRERELLAALVAHEPTHDPYNCGDPKGRPWCVYCAEGREDWPTGEPPAGAKVPHALDCRWLIAKRYLG